MRVDLALALASVVARGCSSAGERPDAAGTDATARTDGAVAGLDAGLPTNCVFPDAMVSADATVFVGDGGWHATSYHGHLGIPLPGGLLGGSLTVPVTVNGVSGPPLLVDTGSPVTYIAPGLFHGSGVVTGSGVVSTLGIGGITLTSATVVGDDAAGGGGLGGNLGSDFLCQFVTTFDFRCRMLSLGGPYPAVGVLSPGSSVPLVLRGGGVPLPGTSTVLDQPTRIVVTATLEGTPHALILDTGNAFTLLMPTLYNQLTADGRAQLSVQDPLVDTSLVPATRIRSVSVGGAEVSDVTAFAMPAAVVTSVQQEFTTTIDGILGVNFLREFLVTADYPGATLTFERYVLEDHIHDEFVRVGVMIDSDGGSGYVVSQVFADSDASRVSPPIAVGEPVFSVDGHTLAGLPLDEADTLLRGAMGETRAVGLTHRTVNLTVTSLLPPALAAP